VTHSAADQWKKLLSRRRLGKLSDAEDMSRTAFQRDFDRIVFSSAFRRLQDKTQVFPLAQNDNVRTRLSHSLEVSCVGRTLGTRVGSVLAERYPELTVDGHDVGAIVAAACLAHDIGNPPFGHAGEDAIRDWFCESDLAQSWLAQLPENQQNDLLYFEGNAQGFRLITKLLLQSNKGGLQLSTATLGTFTKYPCFSDSMSQKESTVRHYKKFGIFSAEKNDFIGLADALGLVQKAPEVWARHPLCYLVEAADDICYRIVDIEDACRRGVIGFDQAESLLIALVTDNSDIQRYHRLKTHFEKLEFLRAKAIGEMVESCQAVFLDNEASILGGTFSGDLLEYVDKSSELKALKDVAKQQIYRSRIVAEVSAPGYTLLAELLERFGHAFEDIARYGTKAHSKHQMIMPLLPDEYQYIANAIEVGVYQRVLALTDYISGMTDAYALQLYKKLNGISLGN
jgi:dGTPase